MVDVKEHGGPCIHPSDVDRLLKRNSGKTRQVGCVKYEIRYLKTVLGVKDKRLIFGKKKDLKVFADDFKFVLSMSADVVSSTDTTCTFSGTDVEVEPSCSAEVPSTSTINSPSNAFPSEG